MHDEAQLVRPTADLSDTYREFVKEFRDREEPLIPWVLGFEADSFEQLVSQLNEFSRGVGLLRPGQVEHSTFWLVDSRRVLLGVSNIRHRLTPKLERKGGHIGFGVRPSQRRKGHATRLLALTLREASALGIHRALLTCDKDNLASAAVIAKNGGVLDSEDDVGGRIIQRYWIDVG